MVDAILKKRSGDLKQIYLVHSCEKILLENFLRKYLDRFMPTGERAFNLNIVEAQGDWFPRVKNMISTLPVMASYRQLILWTRSIRGDEWKDLADYLPQIPETSRLLFLCCGEVDGRLKMVKYIKGEGGLFSLSIPQGRALQRMINKRFTQAELQIAPAAVSLLESSFANDLGRLGQEIDKALLYFKGIEAIGEEDLKDIISQDRILGDTVIFQLVDHIGKKEMGAALKLLREMLLKGESEIYILTMIAWQFRLILLSKDLAQDRMKPQEIASRLKEHPFPIKKSLSQANNFSFSQLERIICRVYQANLDIITGRFAPSLALEILLFDLQGMG